MTFRATSIAPSLGVIPLDATTAHCHVWAPERDNVDIVVDGIRHHLTRNEDGSHSGTISASAGSTYRFVVTESESFPDPCSRFQPDGVRGDSQIVDMRSLAPSTRWTPTPLEDLVLYELHIGTFTKEGTFRAAIERLSSLRSLGVRAIEIMPIATFPGSRGWGYDGLYTSAPHPSYGTPADLAALIEAAHKANLGVFLDVVYNHLGPGAEAMLAFGPYFAPHDPTLWGDAIDYSQHYVREWAIQNAEMWIRDYGIDGLRIDAAHAIVDTSTPHVLSELAARVKAINPDVIVISEIEPGDLRPIEQWGHDAQWGDSLHHAVHVLLTGERESYYAPYGRVSDVADALMRPEAHRLVVCAQNHDQVGNRAIGDRLHGDALRLAAFCALGSTGIPMLFMGEEYDEQHPFQFFTDHIDPAIAEATRNGRRKEFAAFASFAGEQVPDPQAMSTFSNSKLQPQLGDPATTMYYADLLRLHQQLKGAPIATHVDEDRRFLRIQRGPVELAVNFSTTTVDGVPPRSGVVR